MIRPGAIIPIKGITPEKAHEDDAAYDLTAIISWPHFTLERFEWATIPTGVFAAIPEGHVGMVCSRSGMASTRGLFVLNAPGIVDPSYRGEIKVVLMNLGTGKAVLKSGDRIAQLLIVPTTTAIFFNDARHFDSLDTLRGKDGFGSTDT
jgi:dUTP pyrophosphatase